MTNCRNQTGMPGINMYYFSKNKILPQKWIRFVQIHRKDFLPLKTSALCCAHFDDTVVGVVGQRTISFSLLGARSVVCNVYKTS